MASNENLVELLFWIDALKRASARVDQGSRVRDAIEAAGTLADAARVLIERGAASVYAAVSHGLLTATALEA